MAKSTKNIIAFQGVAGAHSDLACRQMHPYMTTLPCASFEDVFTAVEEGKASLGMIPIENSQAGRVAEIHNILPDTRLHFVGEYLQRIEHHLLAPKGTKLKDIKEVYSHPQALMQCRQSIHKLGVESRPHSNTARAAKDVAEWNDKSKAAIGSELAATLYGLEILKKNVEDADNNSTLFITIAKEGIDPDPKKGHVLTTVLFRIRNIPAGLYKAIGGFATNGVNLLKLESYIPGGLLSESAQFFVTFEGSPAEKSVQLALEELGFFTKGVKVLGVYYGDERRFKKVK